MAKAATARRPPREKEGKNLIAFPVQLGNKRTSDKTISIGATIQEANCTPTRAKEYLCYRRMTATLKIGTAAAKDAPGQGKLPGLESVDKEIRAVIETNGVQMRKSRTASRSISISRSSAAKTLCADSRRSPACSKSNPSTKSPKTTPFPSRT